MHRALRLYAACVLGGLLALFLLFAAAAPSHSSVAQGTAGPVYQSTTFQGSASYGIRSVRISEQKEDQILMELATSPLLARLEALTRPRSPSHRSQAPATVLRAPSDDRQASPSPWLSALVVGLLSTILIRSAWAL